MFGYFLHCICVTQPAFCSLRRVSMVIRLLNPTEVLELSTMSATQPNLKWLCCLQFVCRNDGLHGLHVTWLGAWPTCICFTTLVLWHRWGHGKACVDFTSWIWFGVILQCVWIILKHFVVVDAILHKFVGCIHNLPFYILYNRQKIPLMWTFPCRCKL